MGKVSRVDRSWHSGAADEARVELATSNALEISLLRRGQEARHLLREQRSRRKRMSEAGSLSGEKMYPTSYWSDLLGFEPGAVRGWIKSGELEAKYIKGEYRITASAMSTFLAAEEKKRG